MPTPNVCQVESSRLMVLEEMLDELNQEPNTPETIRERKILLRRIGGASMDLQRCKNGADLVPRSIIAVPVGPLITSTIFDLLVIISNNGGKSASGPFNIKVTACSPDIIDDCRDIQNTFISTVPNTISISPGTSRTFYCGRFASRLTPQLPRLTYRLSAEVDSTNQINESNEANNTLRSTQILEIPVIVFHT